MVRTRTPFARVPIPLGVARDNALMEVRGHWIDVERCDGTLEVRLDNPQGDALDLGRERRIETAFERLYFTNAAQSGKEAIIKVGTEAHSFRSRGADLPQAAGAGYFYEEVSLTGARANVEMASWWGVKLTVLKMDGPADCASIRFGATGNAAVPLEAGQEFGLRFATAYLTNTAQAGKVLRVFVVRE